MEQNKQEDCSLGFYTFRDHLLTPGPRHEVQGCHPRSEILLPRVPPHVRPSPCLGFSKMLNPTSAIYKSGNFHKRPNCLSPLFSTRLSRGLKLLEEKCSQICALENAVLKTTTQILIYSLQICRKRISGKMVINGALSQSLVHFLSFNSFAAM